MRYRARVEYDGTEFSGFQVQPGGRTVQGELEAALARLSGGRHIRVAGAGRTDAGVHAAGQVIAFTWPGGMSAAELGRALGAVLPADISVGPLRRVAPDFQPRRAALWREYRYAIWNGPRSPLRERFALGLRELLDVEAMKALKMNALLAVGQGSVRPPRLAVLQWNGAKSRRSKPLCFVGKGVCFDTGGISMKPAQGMEDMKGDMGGAAAVLGAMMAIARLELPLNVTGLIPTVQNLVDAGSVKPGDVVRGLGGKTVEILNTDAEGRLILADALAYATGHLGLRTVVDIATLTGACMRALGPIYGGLFATDDELAAQVAAAGRQGGEKLWRLPLDDEYAAMMQSPIADLRNISTHAGGGASTAAEFLKAFVGEASWAHLDIAGLGLTSEAKPGQPKGATGYGTRTLINLAMALAEDA